MSPFNMPLPTVQTAPQANPAPILVFPGWLLKKTGMNSLLKSRYSSGSLPVRSCSIS